MREKSGPQKLWAGRFNEPTDAFVEAFTASVEFDQRLYRYDIAGSIAHARMLARQGIIRIPHVACRLFDAFDVALATLIDFLL